MASKRAKAKRPTKRTAKTVGRKNAKERARARPQEGTGLRALRKTNLFDRTDLVPVDKGTEVVVSRVFASMLLVEVTGSTRVRRLFLNWAINHSDWRQL